MSASSARRCTDRPVLFVSNHVSWVDILVIGTIMPVVFVAKREVVDLAAGRRRRQIAAHRVRRPHAPPADRRGDRRDAQAAYRRRPVVLFAEGTSSDGNRVLPFRSALVGVVSDAAAHQDFGGKFVIQPMSIGYTGQHGIPMGRQHRPLVAWYGDLDLMPHFKDSSRAARSTWWSAMANRSSPTPPSTARPWRNRWRPRCARSTSPRCAANRGRCIRPRRKSVTKSSTWMRATKPAPAG